MTTAVATTLFFYAVFAATFWIQILPHAEAFVPNRVDASYAITVKARASTIVPPAAFSFDSSVSTRNTPTSVSISISATAASPTALRMGLFDSIASRFRKNNNNEDDEKDFVRLDEMNEKFLGPGPVVLLYQFTDTIDDDEVRDMLADGAPTATKKGISMARIPSMQDPTKSKSAAGTTTTAKKQYSLKNSSSSTSSSSSSSSSEDDQQQRQSNTNNKNSNLHLIDLSLRKALENVIREPPPPILRSSASVLASALASASASAQQQMMSTNTENSNNSGCPVVIFSGFTNTEMMDSYNVLGEELYKETASSSYNGKGQYLACATAVPNAMNKPLAQVLMEISGDHAAAMQPPSEDEDEGAVEA